MKVPGKEDIKILKTLFKDKYGKVKSRIFNCKCGRKYIKTMENQEICLFCLRGKL